MNPTSCYRQMISFLVSVSVIFFRLACNNNKEKKNTCNIVHQYKHMRLAFSLGRACFKTLRNSVCGHLSVFLVRISRGTHAHCLQTESYMYVLVQTLNFNPIAIWSVRHCVILLRNCEVRWSKSCLQCLSNRPAADHHCRYRGKSIFLDK